MQGDDLAHLDERELMSQHIPAGMTCDACGAVAFHVHGKLRRLRQSVGQRQVKSYEVMDALETVCSAGKGELADGEGKPYDWGEYSVKQDPADPTRNILAGPGCAQARPPCLPLPFCAAAPGYMCIS